MNSFIRTTIFVTFLCLSTFSAFADEIKVNKTEYHNATKQLKLFYIGKLNENTKEMQSNYREIVPTGTGETLIFIKYGNRVYLSSCTPLEIEHKAFIHKEENTLLYQALPIFDVIVFVCCFISMIALLANTDKPTKKSFYIITLLFNLFLFHFFFLEKRFDKIIANDLNNDFLSYISVTSYEIEDVSELLRYLESSINKHE